MPNESWWEILSSIVDTSRINIPNNNILTTNKSFDHRQNNMCIIDSQNRILKYKIPKNSENQSKLSKI